MLDKLLKMDSALLTIKVQIAKYTALFAADGTIDASEQAILNALDADAKLIEPKLGNVIEKAKVAANEKSATTEKTEALAVGEVVVTEKAAGGMEVLEAVPAMSGEETVPEEMELNEKSINTLARLEELYDNLNIFSLFSNLYTNRFSPNLPITQRRGAYLDGLEGNLGIKEAFETAKEEFNSKKIQQSDISEYLKLFPKSDSEAMQADKLRNFAALNARLLTVQNKLLPLFF